ncbi:hypothetical protein [Algihabitans albus]|uniref:hypothetical protein n=1 Tax=Algihabitans albus TaxID=2164067 RepID=UPI000E5D639B|nr:hypothetical protein [Algihabitans albus]
MAADRKSDPQGAGSGKALVKARPSRRQDARSKRPSGDPTRQTTLHLTEAILLAAEQSGEDCEGKDGLVGYLRRIANEDIKTFSGFLAKVLPLQVAGDPESPLRVVVATGIERAPDERAAEEAGQETVRTERRGSVSK